METPKVCLALPFYKSAHPLTAFSLLAQLDRTRTSVLLHYGDAFISHTRNKLADQFLKSDATFMLTVDDDMVLPCGNAAWFNDATKFNLPDAFAGAKALPRLLSHGKTLVGALYHQRWEAAKPVYAEGSQKSEQDWLKKGPHDVLKPTQWVGTGCMLIHRDVFLDIEKKFPQLARKGADGGQWFSSSEHDLTQAVEEAERVLLDESTSAEARLDKALNVLRRGNALASKHSSLGTGEDVIFCTRAAQAGHQPFVDCGLIAGHVGNYIFGPRKK